MLGIVSRQLEENKDGGRCLIISMTHHAVCSSHHRGTECSIALKRTWGKGGEGGWGAYFAGRGPLFNSGARKPLRASQPGRMRMIMEVSRLLGSIRVSTTPPGSRTTGRCCRVPSSSFAVSYLHSQRNACSCLSTTLWPGCIYM